MLVRYPKSKAIGRSRTLRPSVVGQFPVSFLDFCKTAIVTRSPGRVVAATLNAFPVPSVADLVCTLPSTTLPNQSSYGPEWRR